MNATEILTTRLALSEFHKRPTYKAEDASLEKSIRKGGIEQPLVVVRDGENLIVVDGGRRLLLAKTLHIPKVPAVMHDLPEGEDAQAYALKLRFIVDEHRQDLLPSQRAQLLQTIKDTRGFGNTELADYLGVAAESIRNWLSPLSYCPEVIAVLDSGRITMNGARVFEGMTPHGQKWILDHHMTELTGEGSKDGLATKLRKQYPPEKHRNFYTNPEVTRRNLDIAKDRRGQQRSAHRTRVANTTAEEKKRLMGSVEMKATEIAENKEELAELKRDIEAATPVVAAIMRNKDLRKYVPEGMFDELKAFADVYVG